MLGKEKMVAIWWTFDSEHRLGEQTYAWMGSFSAQEPPDRLTGRPRTFAPIDAFFDHTSLPGPEDRWLNGYGINVARAYGWPFLCLWEGETVDGSNAGLTKWPWNGFSYGGVKIGPSPSLGHFLPALPLWSGLIGDTVVYGAVFLFLGLLIARIRRARLAHLNLCPNCRYDRAGIRPESPCPECGHGGAASVR
ncbi:MAG TPA: hypothetical protein VHC70_08650 [Phycisphaerales bacterium]|nr:hypothetical protein [Phycisphaerales bacterium]